MEALYKKLYNKYTKLKTSKLHEMDELNKDQEVKFVSCVAAAEELIQHLKSENEKLQVQVKDLMSEMTSIRSTADDRCLDYLNRLMEENRKNNFLSKEVEKLQQLQQDRDLGSLYAKKNCSGQMNSEAAVLSEISNTSLRRSTRKRIRDSPATDAMLVLSNNAQDHVMQRESSNALPEKTMLNETVSDFWQPECCKRHKDESGGTVNSGDYTSCMFQFLVECLVGMELSVDCRTEGMGISAIHKSSGYSFTLTWISKASREETEIIYRVISLGTFERAAPEWMKEVIVFSTEMCPIFFERSQSNLAGNSNFNELSSDPLNLMIQEANSRRASGDVLFTLSSGLTSLILNPKKIYTKPDKKLPILNVGSTFKTPTIFYWVLI